VARLEVQDILFSVDEDVGFIQEEAAAAQMPREKMYQQGVQFLINHFLPQFNEPFQV
jgi:hypothetical protein